GPADIGQPDHPQAYDPATQRIDAATASLAAGRDLLRTHIAARPDGTQMDRSEWAQVVTSAPVARALLLELGLWARRAAAHAAPARRAPQRPGARPPALHRPLPVPLALPPPGPAPPAPQAGLRRPDPAAARDPRQHPGATPHPRPPRDNHQLVPGRDQHRR